MGTSQCLGTIWGSTLFVRSGHTRRGSTGGVAQERPEVPREGPSEFPSEMGARGSDEAKSALPVPIFVRKPMMRFPSRSAIPTVVQLRAPTGPFRAASPRS